ncbi:MAG: MoaD/ThiS family protein [Desulfobacterales bacterium]|nr:MAG: MoaD/ThiS family protein [Desulfobacterales bacterium]
MMKVTVILFGTLRKSFPDHDPVRGFEIEIPEGSRIEDLLAHLNLPTAKLGMVSIDGHLVKAGHGLKNGVVVRVFQPIFGG